MDSGSYDESEHQDQGVEADEDTVDVHEHEHEGEIRFETAESTDALLDRLSEIEDEHDAESSEGA